MRLQCHKHAAGLCRSCTLLETPYAVQLAQKSARVSELLADFWEDPVSPAWLPPVASEIAGFRNRAKFVVSGVPGAVVLGIVTDGQPVDLTDCPVQDARVNAAGVRLAEFLNGVGLPPYSVPERRGELKFVHVTVAPGGELLVRFVVRSMRAAKRLFAAKRELRRVLPDAVVATVNLLPEHRAVLEGEEELVLWGSTLAVPFNDLTLHLLPQSFFQTNTAVAGELYRRVAAWGGSLRPGFALDLYSGVGGFALHLAAAGCPVTGVEISPFAVRAAARSAREAGLRARFVAADATAYALGLPREDMPELVVVNPPRRGIGRELPAWFEERRIPFVVYSSCNPESLAADLAALPGYRIVEGQVFDIFPHTKHLEAAVLLRHTGTV